LPKVAFIKETDHDAFGFLDPGQVIRSAHLILAFASGQGSSSLHYRMSFTHQNDELDNWKVFYVNIFADRDMLMHYMYCGIGH
ncbi:hypothetical protein BDR07DRAFT_1206003, partial [Suillus spraguei]